MRPSVNQPNTEVLYREQKLEEDEVLVELEVGRLGTEGTGETAGQAREEAARLMMDKVERIITGEGKEVR